MGFLFWFEACSCFVPILAAVIFAILSLKYVNRRLLERKLDRWSTSAGKAPSGTVVLHGFTRGKTLPNNSPFVLKLETFLRMAKIPYQFDCEDPFGPKGKTPWISLNGEHVADSQLVIEFITKKFQPKLNARYSEADLASAKAFRIMLEDHWFWGLAHDRFIWHGSEFMNLSIKPWLYKLVYRFAAVFVVKFQTYNHGIGRHSKEDVLRLTCDDLRALSVYLGGKKFVLGDEPCVEDCGIFGQVAQAVWALPKSEYERLVHGELSNLKGYCERMKDRFYGGGGDWEKCLG